MNEHNTNIASQYNKIADNFDVSRVRIWNSVINFLNDDKKGTLLDCGAGNGKNMNYATKLGYDCIGCDISFNLLNICKNKGLNVYYSDILNILNIDNNKYDKIISIAVIHHLETIELQKKAINNLIALLKPNGKLLISLWSYEIYDLNKFKKFTNIGANLVDWKLSNNETIKRFYYIHNYDSIKKMINDLKIISYKIHWELQNWFIEITNVN